MFLDLLLFGLGGRHLSVGGGVFRKEVWRLLICLAVSFGVGGGRGVVGREVERRTYQRLYLL
jgi:hypothetical protein